jgi:DNA-binding PadR family transcriptional regulator
MSAANEPSKDASKIRRSAPALRGPLLGLLINQDQPSHRYKLAGLLAQCLPGWQVSQSLVRYPLEHLEDDGLASSMTSADGMTVFVPTDRTQRALDEWMEEAVSSSPIREELYARIVSSRPYHAPLLLQALDMFEQGCYARLDETRDAETNMGSWKSLTISTVHAAEDEEIRAKIRWAQTTRKAIGDYVRRSSPE